MTAIAITAAACALVWGTWLILRGSVLIGCVVYFVLTACCGAYFFQIDIGGPTWTIDRLFLVLLALAAVVQMRLGPATFKRPLTTQWLLIGLLALLLVSTLTHDWHLGVSSHGSILMRLVNGFAIPAVIYFLARQAPLTQRGLLLLQGTVAAFGVYLAITALCEALGLWGAVFPRYIADPQLGIHFGRARGPTLQAATNGALLVVCGAASWLLLAWQNRWGRWGQLLAVGLVPLFAVAVYVTYTRSAWLSAGLVGLLVLGCTLPGRGRYLLVTGLVVAGLAGAALKWDSLVGFQREDSAAVTRESTYMRASFTYVSWKMFLDRPLLGVGFGQFPFANRPYLSDKDTSLRLESIRGWVHHNTALCILVETGLFGLVLYLALLGAWARSGWRLWRDGRAPPWLRAHGLLLLVALVCYVCELAFHDVTYATTDNVLVFLLAGVAAGYEYAARQQDVASAAVASNATDSCLPRPATGAPQPTWSGHPA